ncbi:hypothetical protein HanPSC8_Chr01g0024661 [Helianthus annuus]|nr:hypothetical protein HanPSC8_Chr01g0024661 [Helianthus annuus]
MVDEEPMFLNPIPNPGNPMLCKGCELTSVCSAVNHRKSIKSQVFNNVLSRLSRIIRVEPSSAQMFSTFGNHV